MMSIRRRRQLTKIGVTIAIIAAIVALIAWLSFGAKGLTKRSVYVRELPRSTLLYLACKGPLRLTERFLESEYASDLREEEAVRTSLQALRSAVTACNSLPFFPRSIIRSALSRDAAFILLSGDATNIAESRAYVVADIGNLPCAVLSIIGTPVSTIRLAGRHLEKRRSSYRGVTVEEWREGDAPVFYNAWLRGRIIGTGGYSNLVFLIDFYRSKGPALSEERFLRDAADPGAAPVQAYFHTARFRTSALSSVEPLAFIAGKLIRGDEVFASARPHARETDVTLSINHHGNASYELSEVFGPARKKTAHLYFPRSTVLLLSLSARDMGRWYASAYAYATTMTTVRFAAALAASLNSMNARTGIADLLPAVGGEAAIGVLRGTDTYHVVVMCVLKDEATALPALEASLAKRTSALRKREIRFKDRFIYYYDLGDQKIFFCPIRDRFFFSYDLDALKDVIVSASRNDNLASKSPHMNAMGLAPSHGMFYFNFPLSYEYFSTFGMLRRESFPRIVYLSLRAESDTLSLSGKLLVNLERAR